jgi:hypothetical protein
VVGGVHAAIGSSILSQPTIRCLYTVALFDTEVEPTEHDPPAWIVALPMMSIDLAPSLLECIQQSSISTT